MSREEETPEFHTPTTAKQHGYYAPQLRAAIVGTGGIARVHGFRLQDLGSAVVGVCGRTLSGAEQLARDLTWSPADHSPSQPQTQQAIPAFTDLGEMLDTVRPDVLHVCSPHGLHSAHTRAAMKRGIHVVCEKPLATDATDAEKLSEESRAAGIHAAICLTKRSYPMVAELRARLASGEAGRVRALRGGFLSSDSSHDEWGWGFDPAIAGPSYATADLGVHWFDLAEHVTSSRITTVDARFSTIRTPRYRDNSAIDVTLEDYVRVNLEFDSGIVGSAVFSGVSAGEPNGCSIDVDGDNAGYHWRVDRPEVLERRNFDASRTLIPRHPEPGLSVAPIGHAEGFGDAFRNLFRGVYCAIGGEAVQYPTFADGSRMARLVEATIQSAQTRREVAV